MSSRDANPEPWADLLTQAWDEHAPPPPTPALAQTDETTRATVELLARAWDEHAAPSVEPPALLRRAAHRRAQQARPVLRVLDWRRHAAAAALLLGLGAALHYGGPRSAPTRRVAPDELVADARVVAVAADHIEMRSGPVRLLLFTNQDSPSPTDDAPIGGETR